MKIVVFRHNPGLSDHDTYEEEFQLDDDTTEEEINEMYIDWMIQRVGDDFTWYEKDEKK